jgi:HEAT repeat protein
MFQGSLGLVVVLVIVIVVVSLVLLALVIAFKISRDRRERRAERFRDRLWKAWVANDTGQLVKTYRIVARGGHQAQSDFIQVSERAVNADWWTPDMVEAMREAAEKAGFSQALRKQLTSRSAVKRGLAVTMAGYPGATLQPQELAPFLTDSEPTVRLAAAGSLERLADPQSADVLITALINEDLPDERIIERMGHDWAVPSIVSLLEDSAREVTSRVRCGLARALALAADPRAMPVLELMSVEGAVEEKVQALKALVACTPHANDQQRAELEIFARHLVDDEHPVVRTQVALILGAAGYESDIPILARLVTDNDWFVRRAAARALAQMGSPGLQALRRLAASDDRFAAERAREEITFATIMAARQAAHTGQDFEGILARGSAASDGPTQRGGSSAAVAAAAASAAVAAHRTATAPLENPPGPNSAATGGSSGLDTSDVPTALAPTITASAIPVTSQATTEAPVAPPVLRLAVEDALAESSPQRVTIGTNPLESPIASYVPAIVFLQSPRKGTAGIPESSRDEAEVPGSSERAVPQAEAEPATTGLVTSATNAKQGHSVIITGRCRPRARGRRARLEVLVGDRWRKVDTTALTSKGRFVFGVDDTGMVGATYTYRIVILRRKKNRPLVTGEPMTITVVP